MVIEASDWEPVRMRMVALEHDIYSWTSLLPNMQATAPAGEIQRVTMIRDSAQAELSCLRALLAFWEEHSHAPSRKEISQPLFIFLFAGYGALILAIMFYLVVIAAR